MLHCEASPILCICEFDIGMAVKQTGALRIEAPLYRLIVYCLENELCVVIETVLPYCEVVLAFWVFDKRARHVVLVAESLET